MREFTTAAKQAGEKVDEGTPFKVDGFEMTAYKPEPGQFAMLMATTGRGSSDEESVAGVINFLVNIVDRRGAAHLQKRLLDRSDPYEVDNIQDLIEWLVEEWSGNPTPEPSGSTRSQSTDGQNSTPTSSLLT